MTFYSQAGQDEWIVDLFNNKQDGFFVEIGAYDGIQTSNTYYLEKELGWDGICIEANKNIFPLLEANRKSINLNTVVSDHEGSCLFGGDYIVDSGGYEMPCSTLNNILSTHAYPKIIDYISIDIEGHECAVLGAFDFSNWNIRAMTVEHNLYMCGPERKNKLYEILSSNGFIRVVEDAVCLDTNPAWYNQPYEDWYVSAEFLREKDLWTYFP